MLQQHYGYFDFPQLKAQLQTLAVSFDYSSSASNPCLQDVTDHLHKLTQGQLSLLNQVSQLAQLYMVMPASNAVSERTFSSMRRIKTCLTNAMTRNRLNHSICLSIHS